MYYKLLLYLYGTSFQVTATSYLIDDWTWFEYTAL